MNTKDLSPAFITSLVAIFLAALMIGSSSTVLTVLGWFILLVALGLNVFSSMVSIQRAQGGPLPAMITADHRVSSRRADAAGEEDSRRASYRDDYQDDEPSYEYEPEEDTEAQPLVSSVAASSSAPASEEKIFRSRAPRPRNR